MAGKARPKVVVLDYGSGNLRSAQRALARVGADVEVTADADAALECDGLAVPGVGAVRGLHGRPARGRRRQADRAAAGAGAARSSASASACRCCSPPGWSTGTWTEGCGAWPGTVERLDAGVLPHMGWNTVAVAPGSALFAGIAPGTRFYFVHSYALRAAGSDELAALGARISWTEHGEPFAAAAEQGAGRG